MDHPHFNTEIASHVHGKHLSLDERGQIQALHREGLSLRKIAERVGCAHTTVMYELRRGTPDKKPGRGRKPMYSAKRGHRAYLQNRSCCRKHLRIEDSKIESFIQWTVEHVRNEKWSLDACVGNARLNSIFEPSEMVCTKTLYNALASGKLPLSVFEVPRVLSHKKNSNKTPKNRRHLGRSIDERPSIVDELTEVGHWEADTVVGKKCKGESVVFSLVERVTNKYIAIKIPRRTADAVAYAMNLLYEEYGDKFSEVFKSITADNGPEFSEFSSFESWGTKIYFAHPYSSWERSRNEHHNGMFREFVPKGVSINEYTDDEILDFADSMNARPRRSLGYHYPDELFDAFLDQIYAA